MLFTTTYPLNNVLIAVIVHHFVANGSSSCVAGQSTSFASRESHGMTSIDGAIHICFFVLVERRNGGVSHMIISFIFLSEAEDQVL